MQLWVSNYFPCCLVFISRLNQSKWKGNEMWIVSQFSRTNATVETYVSGPYTLVCSSTPGEALVQSRWSLALTPASLAENKDFQKWLHKLSWKQPWECCLSFVCRANGGTNVTIKPSVDSWTRISLANMASLPSVQTCCTSHIIRSCYGTRQTTQK